MDGIRLMVMGRLKSGGSGCYCAENTVLQSLMAHLLVVRNEVVILDMAAGIEHLSRATARSVDCLIIVVEPGRKSLDTALRIKKMAQEINLTRIAIVGNKIRNPADREFILTNLPGFTILGFIPYDTAIIDAEISYQLSINASQPIMGAVRDIYQKLILMNQNR
jgi:CO dehydrogenase maturation factor